MEGTGQKLKPEDVGPEEMIHDPHFLNALQKGVGTWIANIRKVTALER